MHHNRIIHRDIKGDNICMSGFVSRIIDFGMARSLIFDGVRADGGEMLKHHIRYAEADEENEEEMDDAALVPRMVSSCPRSTAQYSAPEALLCSFGAAVSTGMMWQSKLEPNGYF